MQKNNAAIILNFYQKINKSEQIQQETVVNGYSQT